MTVIESNEKYTIEISDYEVKCYTITLLDGYHVINRDRAFAFVYGDNAAKTEAKMESVVRYLDTIATEYVEEQKRCEEDKKKCKEIADRVRNNLTGAITKRSL